MPFEDQRPASREDFERAADDLKRERAESGYGRGYYDYTPDPTPAEIWERMQYNRNPYPDRG